MDSLHQHICELTVERALDILMLKMISPLLRPHQHKVNALSAWISLWVSKRRKICTLAIRDPQGNPATREYLQLIFRRFRRTAVGGGTIG